MSAAFWALFDFGVRHLLPLFEPAGAFIAKIFVGWQERSPTHILGLWMPLRHAGRADRAYWLA
jgi:hypothetical protein